MERFMGYMFFLFFPGVFYLQGPQHRQPDQHCDCEVSHIKQRVGKGALK